MIDTPRIVQTTKQLIAYIPLNVPAAEVRNVMGPGVMEVMKVVAAQSLAPTGAWFTHHRQRPGARFDFSICVPVPASVTPSGRVLNGELPATTVARTVYQGPYEGLGGAWAEFLAWVTAHGHTPRPDLWECYVHGPESGADPVAWRTELNQPLEKPSR
ncbi:MAG TPA: GyrI-like domain-containing protein [Planctomycetota bacterium]|jgi:effector-binding domain-containing protein|nr:GyrI-like domain-containing protein [Planctomycetota bacterium]